MSGMQVALSLHFQESTKKNRDSKRRLMASTQDLLKRQQEEEEEEERGRGIRRGGRKVEPSLAMAMLAAEAAAEAATRSEKLRCKVLGGAEERGETQGGRGEEKEGGRRRKRKRGSREETNLPQQNTTMAAMNSTNHHLPLAAHSGLAPSSRNKPAPHAPPHTHMPFSGHAHLELTPPIQQHSDPEDYYSRVTHH